MAGGDGLTWGATSATVNVGETVTVSVTYGAAPTSAGITSRLNSLATATLSGSTVAFTGVSAGTVTIPSRTNVGNACLTSNSFTLTVTAPTEDESYLNKRGLTHFWENIDDLKQNKLTAGAGISITNDVISATGGGTADAVDWGHITGSMSNQTDLTTALAAKANTADLAAVATSGSYNDLSDRPTIPGGTITGVSVNNTSIATSGVANIPLVSRTLDGAVPKTNAVGGAYDGYVFGIDADTAKWMKLSYNSLSNKPTIPTKTSDLTNDSGFLTSYTETDPIYSASPAAGITSADITTWNNKSDFSGSYNDLTNKPTIPSLTRRTSASSPATVGSLVLGGDGTSALPYAFPTIVGTTNDESFWSYIRTTDITNGISEAYLGAYEYDPTENWWSGKKEARLALYSDLAGKANTADLATVATSGLYSDLNSRPTIGNALITIQKNGVSAGSFTTNATSSKTINITVPTDADDVGALPDTTKYGASISVSVNTTDYKVTTTLKDQDGNTLGTAQVVDLPLESVVVNGSYDSTNKKIVLTLQNGNTIDIPVADLIAGLQTEITSTNMLASDLVDDTNQTHKFMTSAEKTKLSGIAAGAEVNVQSDWNQTTATADDYIKNKPSIPTKTSDLTNDSNFVSDASYVHTDNNYTTTDKNKLAGIAAGAEVNVQANWTQTTTTADDYIKNKPTLATVATSGSYNDLSNKPTIPTVNNGTLTIQKNGTNVATFTANQSGNSTANITVPTQTSELTNNSGFITAEDITSTAALTPPVSTDMIENGAVTTAKLGTSAVTNAKLATAAVQTTNILDNAVTSSKIDWASMPYKLDVWTGALAASTGAAVIRQVDVSAFPTGAVFGVVTAVNASGSETTTGMFINLSHSTQASPYIGNVTTWGKAATMCHIFTKVAGANTMNIQGYKDNASAVNYNSITTIVWRIA